MPKQTSITKELVDEIAFELVRKSGIEALTARSIAREVGCSTQPIYKIYRNLDALKESVLERVGAYIDDLIFSYDKTSEPFLNAGLGFVHFAATERVLFRVFVIENYLGKPVFFPLGNEALYRQMEKLLAGAPLDEQQRRELFLNMMVYTNGLVNMAYAGQLGMNERQVAEHLIGFFTRFSGVEWEGEINL